MDFFSLGRGVYFVFSQFTFIFNGFFWLLIDRTQVEKGELNISPAELRHQAPSSRVVIINEKLELFTFLY